MQHCAIICKQNQKRISSSFEANTRLQLQNTMQKVKYQQSKQTKNADKVKAQIDKPDFLESRNRIMVNYNSKFILK